MAINHNYPVERSAAGKFSSYSFHKKTNRNE
jgi:hypothetical protein